MAVEAGSDCLDLKLKFKSRVENTALKSLSTNGLTLNKNEYDRILRKQFKKGKKIQNKLLNGALQTKALTSAFPSIYKDFFEIRFLHRVASFGYHMSCVLQKSLSSKKLLKEVALSNTYFNVGISLFDLICDNYPALKSNVLSIINRKHINRLLSGKYENPIDVINLEERDNPFIIEILLQIVWEYFYRIGKMHNRYGNEIVWKNYKETILSMFEAEVQSTERLPSSDHSLNQIYTLLRNKSSLPFWAMLLPSFFSNLHMKEVDLERIKEITMILGDIFWIVDDLVDCINDLDDKKWNYLWYKLFLKSRDPAPANMLVKLPESTILKKALASDVVESTCSELMKKLVYIIELIQTQGKNRSRMVKYISFWVQNWLLSV